jgi:hypothetical protein
MNLSRLYWLLIPRDWTEAKAQVLPIGGADYLTTMHIDPFLRSRLETP